jgi:hypothetical protein
MNTDEFKNNLKTILESDQIPHKKYKALLKVAFNIFVEASDHYHDGTPISYTKEQEEFQEYMYEWNILGSKQIPFELWSDIAETGISLLRKMHDSGNLNYKNNPEFRPFCRIITDRIIELKKDPRFVNHFDEWID